MNSIRIAPGAGKWTVAVVLGLLSAALILTGRAVGRAGDAEDSCVKCHSNPDFLVTNKKLYDYFQQWKTSIHEQEGVACDDCHGGNPNAEDKDAAHGRAVGESSISSAINFRNIPATCGRCHDDVLKGFRSSEHYRHVVAKKQERQGPTCVTCHGSINVDVLNVNSVEQSCARCHNKETGNHPENPARARDILNRFLSIHHYYRFLTHRLSPQESRAFFSRVDKKVNHLVVTWHTFDLDAIEKETREVLQLLKDKRNEIRKRAAGSR